MEIVKSLCKENPPFNSTENYSLSFKLNNALTDMTSSYTNIPVSIDEIYNATLTPFNPIGNVNIGNDLFMSGVSHVSSLFIRNVNLTADGKDLVYTNFINTLATNLAVYLYNNAEARMIEYMATEEPTVNETLINQSTRNHLFSSLYRELYNDGSTNSVKNSAFIRLPLKEILGQFATEIRDLTKYQEVIMTLQLDAVGLTAHANSDSFYPDNATAGKGNTRTAFIQNAHPLSDFGYSVPIAGTVTGTNTFTFTRTDLTLANFPIRVGDSVNFVTINAAKAITAVNVVNGIIVSLTAVGLTDGAETINNNTVPTTGVFTVQNAVKATMDVKWLNKNISCLKNNGTLNVFANDSTNVINTVQMGTDVVFVLDTPASASIAGTTANPGFIAYNGLSLDYTGNATVNAGTNIPTVGNFTNKTFSFWVGQAVFITGSANVTPVYAKITEISYSGGHAEIKLNVDVVVGGGNAATLNLFTIHPDDFEIKLERKFELVQLKLNSMFAKQLPLSNRYEKWIYDGDVVLPLAPYSSFEKTFMLDPLTKMVVICITKDNTLNSTKDTLSSYRILIDGNDTTNREIDLNDEAMKNERLMSGFNSFYEDLHCVQTKTTNNPFSTDNNSYTILQEVPVDGREHKITILLKNGDTLSTSSNLRLYKLVLAQIN
jgi:hypothetical protein